MVSRLMAFYRDFHTGKLNAGGHKVNAFRVMDNPLCQRQGIILNNLLITVPV
jgi:hypothetical protein